MDCGLPHTSIHLFLFHRWKLEHSRNFGFHSHLWHPSFNSWWATSPSCRDCRTYNYYVYLSVQFFQRKERYRERALLRLGRMVSYQSLNYTDVRGFSMAQYWLLFYRVCVWTALLLFLLAIFNASRLINRFTRIAGELFGMLISVLFIQEAIKVCLGRKEIYFLMTQVVVRYTGR